MTGDKADKYEQILAKYDWHADRPPRGYRYGVGRGARAFTTTAELSIGVPAAMQHSPQEKDFFAALDRVDGRGREEASPASLQKELRQPSAAAGGTSTAGDSSPRPKLSLEDLATVGMGLAGASLTVRSARTEAADAAEEYFFSDERGVTVHDLLKGKNLAAQHSLQNLLEMGSPEEQTTWITHARVYREMGMAKKAVQTLIEGCRLTGKQGRRIWEERLSFLTEDNQSGRRRVLEEAVTACPEEEELWLQLLQFQPPHEVLTWLQRGVISCPTSEKLWVQVVERVQSAADQKRIIQRALQRTPNLPLLWSKLARLETYQVGREVFRAAAQRHPSLILIIEAAVFVEWSMHSAPFAEHSKMKQELAAIVRTAAQQYLHPMEETSRGQWLGLVEGEAEGALWTAAHMYVQFAFPESACRAAVHESWLQDLVAILGAPWERQGVLCSLWAAWLVIQEQVRTASSDRVVTPTSAAADDSNSLILDIIRVAVETAPSSVLDDVGRRLLAAATAVAAPLPTVAAVALEEEELGLSPVALSSSSSGRVVAAASSCSLQKASPPPLYTVVACTLSQLPLLRSPLLSLTLAKALYHRKQAGTALRVLQLGEVVLCHEAPAFRVQFACAIAKVYASLGDLRASDAALVAATQLRIPLDNTPVEGGADLAWVKLLVHRRSMGEDISSLLVDGLQHHPRSARLWLMKLQQVRQQLVAAKAVSIIPPALIKDARSTYEAALDERHCREFVAIWVYAAVQIESDALASAATARALLLDAALALRQTQAVTTAAGAKAAVQKAEVAAQLGMARARVERLHAGDGPALEIVQETLQKLPKTREGTFTVPVGELLQWYIDLEAPASRGRAAAQVMRQWRSRAPLALLAVAKLYDAAGHCSKALDQAVKAVEAGEGLCGDAVAFLWHLAQQLRYKAVVGPLAGANSQELEEAVAATPLDPEIIRRWVISVAAKAQANATHEQLGEDFPVPKSGPLWLLVAKEVDPTNVTLLGYRDSVDAMLSRVMALL